MQDLAVCLVPKYRSGLNMMHIVFCVILIQTLFQSVLLEGNAFSSASGQGLEKESMNDCDVVIREQYGLIRSPSYPGKYPRYSRCHYTVYRSSPDTCEVKLTVERFEVAKMTFSNCSADYFEIQNGHKKYKLCGELPPGSKKFVFYPNNSDRLTFKFQSTFHQKRGFSIEVKQLPFSCKKEYNVSTHATLRLPPPCSQTISGRIGRITFPDFTEDDEPIERCTYTIKRSEARACVVQLDFSSFEITETAGCETDYLALPGDQRLCGVLGGSRKLLQFSPDSDELVLEFVSSSQNGNSFDIQVAQLPGPCQYSTGAPNRTDVSLCDLDLVALQAGKVPQQCDQSVHGNEGRITSPGYPGDFSPNFRCIYAIFRPDPSVCQLELDFLSFNLGRYNPPGCTKGAFLELPGRTRLCHEFNGKMLLKVSEFKDPVILYFQSDSQTSGRGFDIGITQIPNTCPGYNDHSEIPNALKRCYQEVTSHTGYFSSSFMHVPTPFQIPMWCEFAIRRADPTVCRVKLQLTARTFINLPCTNNFIHLPGGERMCISVTEKRDVWIPDGSEFITLVYYNTHNPAFNLFVEQISNSCTNQSLENKSKSRRWAWDIAPR